MNVHDLGEMLIERFPKTNIAIESYEIDDENIEYFGDNNQDKFDIHILVAQVDEFDDIKTRTQLEISGKSQISPSDVMHFLQDISKKINLKMYIRMTDIEKTSWSLSDCLFWCIHNNKRGIVFDSEVLCNDPKSAYYDHMRFN